MSFETLRAWKQVTPELQGELVAFWTQHRAIADPVLAAARAKQAVCLLRDEEGALCGVSTAVIRVLPRLRQPLYYFRQFFTESIRGRKQSIPFYNASCDLLRDYNASLKTPESLGVLIELENPLMARLYERAWVDEAGSVFLGYSPRGHQLRATYFEGARLLAPAPLGRRRPLPA